MLRSASLNLALMLVFMLGVIFTMQLRRGSIGSPKKTGIASPHEDGGDYVGPSKGPNTANGGIAVEGAVDDLETGAVTKSPNDAAPIVLTPEEIQAREKAEIEKEDKFKEDIPTLMRRPVKRPRQSMNNITGGTYWAYGSWGRVVATSSACWAHPVVDSFAIQCTKKILPRSILMKIEYVSTLEILKSRCVSCIPVKLREQGSPPQQDLEASGSSSKMIRRVADVSGGGGSKKSGITDTESSEFIVGNAIPRLQVSTVTFAVDSAACTDYEATFKGTCVVKIDLLFRAKKTKRKNKSGGGNGANNNNNKNNKKQRGGDAPPPEICFITLGDWGSNLPEQSQVADVLIKTIERRMVKFIISTGDNFYPTGVQSVNDQQWLTTFEKPYAHVALQRLRWYICAGNHDQWGLPPQKEYSVEHPRWYFPGYHYNDTIPLYRDTIKDSRETIELAVLNTAGRDIHVQCEMFDTFYSRVEDRHGGYMHDMSRHWRLVVNHEPLFSGGLHGAAPRGKMLRQQFQPYMQQSLIHAYFNGDDHFLEIHRANGTDYFTSGAGGGGAAYFTVQMMNDTAVYQMEPPKTVRGFMLHCIKEGEMITTLVDGISGRILFQYRTNYYVDVTDFMV